MFVWPKLVHVPQCNNQCFVISVLCCQFNCTEEKQEKSKKKHSTIWPLVAFNKFQFDTTYESTNEFEQKEGSKRHEQKSCSLVHDLLQFHSLLRDILIAKCQSCCFVSWRNSEYKCPPEMRPYWQVYLGCNGKFTQAALASLLRQYWQVYLGCTGKFTQSPPSTVKCYQITERDDRFLMPYVRP